MERERRAQRHMQRAMQLMEEQSFGARSRIQEESFGGRWKDFKKDYITHEPRDHKDDLQEVIDELKVKYKELEKQYQVKTEKFEEQVVRVHVANKKEQECNIAKAELVTKVDDLKRQLTKENEKSSAYFDQYQELNQMMKKEREERDVLRHENARLKELVPKDQMVENEDDKRRSAEIQRVAKEQELIQKNAGMR